MIVGIIGLGLIGGSFVKAYHAEEMEIANFGLVNRKYFKTLVKALKNQLFMQPLTVTQLLRSVN